MKKNIIIIILILLMPISSCLPDPFNKRDCREIMDIRILGFGFNYLGRIQADENEFREDLQKQGYSSAEIEEKVKKFRELKQRAMDEFTLILLNILKSYQDCLKYVEHKQRTLQW